MDFGPPHDDPAIPVETRSITGAPSASDNARPAPTQPPSSPAPGIQLRPYDEARVEKLEADAEAAIRAKDLVAALPILEELLSYAANEHTPRAHELLGILRERAGRFVEARAIYTDYLARYPGDEGVSRVKQRLAAIDKGTTIDQPERPGGTGGRNGINSRPPFMIHGVISQTYLRDRSRSVWNDARPVTESTGIDRRTNVDQLLSTAAITGTARLGSTRIEARADMSHVSEYRPVILVGAKRNNGSYDFIDRAQVEILDEKLGAAATIGRQTSFGSGPFGRFDGILVKAPATDRVNVNVVVGHPVWSSRQTAVDSSRTFYSLGVDVSSSDKSRRFSLSWFDQRASGLVDRQAINFQLQLARPNASLLAVIDYDVLFNVLSTAYLSLNLNLKDGSSFAVTAQQVHYPQLAIWNAVLGQPVPTLDAVRQALTPSQIKQAARDRTMVSRMLTTTYSRQISPKWQSIFDATLSHTSGSRASFDVPEFPEAGGEVFVGAQLVGSSILRPHDSIQFGLRYADLQRSRIVQADASARLPVTDRFSLIPQARFSYRDQRHNTGHQTMASTSMRAVYRVSDHGEFEAQGGINVINQTYTIPAVTGTRSERAFIGHIGYRLRF